MKNNEEKTERKSGVGILVALITVVFIVVVTFVTVKIISSAGEKPPEDVAKFSLNDEFYHTDGIAVGLTAEGLAEAVAAKKSFVVYASLPVCTENTALFKQYVTEYQAAHNISFYYMTTDVVKTTPIYDTVKYFPSVILYQDGELKKYLDFNSDADIEYYKSAEGFAGWFEKYIDVKE